MPGPSSKPRVLPNLWFNFFLTEPQFPTLHLFSLFQCDGPLTSASSDSNSSSNFFLVDTFGFFFFHIQICVTSEEEQDGFIRVLSGKKRGLVPLDVLEDIWLLAAPPSAVGKLCCDASSHTVSTQRSCRTDPATQETVRQDSRIWDCGRTATRQRAHRTAYPGCPRRGWSWESRLAERSAVLSMGSRAATTAVRQDSTPALSVWCKLTCWNVPQVCSAAPVWGSDPCSQVWFWFQTFVPSPNQSASSYLRPQAVSQQSIRKSYFLAPNIPVYPSGPLTLWLRCLFCPLSKSWWCALDVRTKVTWH